MEGFNGAMVEVWCSTRDRGPSTAPRLYGPCGAQGVMVETDGAVLWCIFKGPVLPATASHPEGTLCDAWCAARNDAETGGGGITAQQV